MLHAFRKIPKSSCIFLQKEIFFKNSYFQGIGSLPELPELGTHVWIWGCHFSQFIATWGGSQQIRVQYWKHPSFRGLSCSSEDSKHPLDSLQFASPLFLPGNFCLTVLSFVPWRTRGADRKRWKSLEWPLRASKGPTPPLLPAYDFGPAFFPPHWINFLQLVMLITFGDVCEPSIEIRCVCFDCQATMAMQSFKTS